MADLATLLAQPDKDVHVLDLYGSNDRSGSAGALGDRDALAEYRRRLSDLDARAGTQGGGGGEASRCHPPPVRRCPAFAAHVGGAVVTGMHCRYRGDGGPAWRVTEEAADRRR